MTTNTKHQPATPLPWVGPWGDTNTVAGFDGRHDWTPESDPLGDAFPLAQEVDPQDAAYIAHACNAYPRLVEALRDMVECKDRDAAAVIGRALLKELGE